MEAREKLCCINIRQSQKYFKMDVLAMCHVLKTWRINQISRIIISQFDRYHKNGENFLSYNMLKKELGILGYTHAHTYSGK